MTNAAEKKGDEKKGDAEMAGQQAQEENKNEALAESLKKDWQSWKEKTFAKKDEAADLAKKAPESKKQWEQVKHLTWKKTFVEVVKKPSDKEEASSSKRKDPPSPDWGGSSPEPSSAEPYETEASFDKRDASKKLPPLPKWVAVDWYRTIELSNGYIQKGALRALKEAGVKVWVLSFCGKERSEEVQEKYDGLLQEGLVDTISFTWSKTGRNGKKATMENWGVEYLFDDAYDIIREATAAGMVCYWIGPQQDGQSEYDAYPDLMAAVERFLGQHEPN